MKQITQQISKRFSILRLFHYIKFHNFHQHLKNQKPLSNKTNSINLINDSQSFIYSFNYFAFSKSKGENKKAKNEKEKENIHKQYDSVSVEDLKMKYKDSAEV